MKQTSIEWLQDQFRAFGTITDSSDELTHNLIKSAINMCEQAKEINKQEIIKFAEKYEDYVFNSINNNRYIQVKSAEQYYNETFKKD